METSILYKENKRIKKEIISTEHPLSCEMLQRLDENYSHQYLFINWFNQQIEFDEAIINEWLDFAVEKDAEISYAYHSLLKNNQSQKVEPISYTEGSIRDNFDFGALVLIKKSIISDFLDWNEQNYVHAGWYALRLYASRIKLPILFNKEAYNAKILDLRKSGEKQFDYTDPSNRNLQIEMEDACTIHLDLLNAKLTPPFKPVNLNDASFTTEASVIIPVLNREKTILDAVQSVLKQATSFNFNVIVVDNHSTDNTSKILQNISDPRLIHLIPDRSDLGIGGCWNEGIEHPQCGKFAIQLDSDDLYIDNNTLQKIVDQFYKDNCAMVIGSYELVNFNLEPIPPGLIDHKEWTHENGPNNALRINGFGAPRAFYTPIIRQIQFPNVSYGEDYAVALVISGIYKVGRIYDSLYLCRRWSDNTDADLKIETVNKHNLFKDTLRTLEINRRQRKAQKKDR